MRPLESSQIERLLADKDYAGLEKRLAQADVEAIAGLWPSIGPFQRLLVFKLVDAGRALALYDRLDFRSKYDLLCGFPLQAIAPALEPLSASQRLRFTQLPRQFYDLMFRRLLAERAELPAS